MSVIFMVIQRLSYFVINFTGSRHRVKCLQRFNKHVEFLEAFNKVLAFTSSFVSLFVGEILCLCDTYK